MTGIWLQLMLFVETLWMSPGKHTQHITIHKPSSRLNVLIAFPAFVCVRGAVAVSKTRYRYLDKDLEWPTECMSVRCTGSELSLAECTIYNPQPITNNTVAIAKCYKEPKGAFSSRCTHRFILRKLTSYLMSECIWHFTQIFHNSVLCFLQANFNIFYSFHFLEIVQNKIFCLKKMKTFATLVSHNFLEEAQVQFSFSECWNLTGSHLCTWTD